MLLAAAFAFAFRLLLLLWLNSCSLLELSLAAATRPSRLLGRRCVGGAGRKMDDEIWPLPACPCLVRLSLLASACSAFVSALQRLSVAPLSAARPCLPSSCRWRPNGLLRASAAGEPPQPVVMCRGRHLPIAGRFWMWPLADWATCRFAALFTQIKLAGLAGSTRFLVYVSGVHSLLYTVSGVHNLLCNSLVCLSGVHFWPALLVRAFLYAAACACVQFAALSRAPSRTAYTLHTLRALVCGMRTLLQGPHTKCAL